MRDIKERLHRALVLLAAHFVEHEREQDRRREGEHHAVNVQQQRVAEGSVKHRGLEEAFKILKSDPFAAPDAQIDFVVLKGDLYAVQRRILEDDVIQDGWYEQQIQITITPQRLGKLALA